MPDSIPAPSFPRQDEIDQVQVFCETAADAGWHTRRLTSRPDGDALIGALLDAHEIRTAVITSEPEAEAMGEVLAAAGVSVAPFASVEQAAAADLGVTGARYGVAATGSVVVDTDRAGSRSVSLVPPVHLAVVSASDVVATPSDVWGQLVGTEPAEMPSQIVWITGPSRSGDIEFTLTVGVHGPRAVWLAVLG